MTHRAYTIGIIAGSGPEAGIDLWTKVLTATQQQLGAVFEGDIDAPRVVIVSEPQLGLSMDLRANEAATWDALARTVSNCAAGGCLCDCVQHIELVRASDRGLDRDCAKCRTVFVVPNGFTQCRHAIWPDPNRPAGRGAGGCP